MDIKVMHKQHARDTGSRPFFVFVFAALLLASALVLMVADPARTATTFTVNSKSDTVDANIGDGACATRNDRCTLRAAVQEANALSGPDTIRIPAGEYPLTLAPRDGANSGDHDVTGQLTITGAGAGKTILDGGQPPAGSAPERRGLDRLFEIHPSAGDVSISGLTVREGYSADVGGAVRNASPGSLRLTNVKVLNSYAGANGGGVHNAGAGSVIVQRSTISGNAAGGDGGGIYNAGKLGGAGQRARIALTVSDISDNTAGGAGGGIYNDLEGHLNLTDANVIGNSATTNGGGINNVQKASVAAARGNISDNTAGGAGGGMNATTERLVTIEDTQVSGNDAGEAGGGGLYTADSGAVNVTGATFSDNTAAGEGGGVAIHSDGRTTVADTTLRENTSNARGGGMQNSGSLVSLIRLTVVGNTAAAEGGGIDNQSGGELTLLDSNLEANTGQNGGGLSNASDAPLTVSGTTFRNNTARQSGGGFVNNSDAATGIENSTFSGNNAGTSGGGLHTEANADTRIVSTTIFRNSALQGGGIGHLEGQASTLLMVRNTIVAGSEEGDSCSGAVGSEGGNLDSGDSCQFRGSGDRRNAAPGLDAIADNGGPTLTHALQAESRAVDGGQNPCPAADQRGVERPQNRGCDVGAVEFEGIPRPPDETAPETTITRAPDSSDGIATFEFTGSDDVTGEPDLRFECRLLSQDPAEPTEPTDPEFQFAACLSPHEVLPEAGQNTFEVRAIDDAGNVDPTPATHIFTDRPDTDAPDTRFTETPPNPSTGRTATFGFAATDDLTPPELIEYECRLDYDPNAPTDPNEQPEPGEPPDPELEGWIECVNPVTFSNLIAGEHTVEVRAVDEGDNYDPTPAAYTWTVLPPTDCSEANVTLNPAADSWIEQSSPDENFGFDENLIVRSGIEQENARTLVRFALPADVPEECELISAKMRLSASSGTPGRTLVVSRLASGWSEASVNWNNKPPITGATATTTSGSAGTAEWDVKTQVKAMYAGANHGFLIRDAVDGDVNGAEQSYSSRENFEIPATLPALVLRYESPDGPPPPPPPPPAPEPAQVSCGQVLTRSTLVMNNLSNCRNEGLVIGASNIAVDLNGRTIDGTSSSSGSEEGLPAAIRNSGHDNVHISNGTVQEFGYGVYLGAGSKYNVVEGLNVRRNVLAGIELSDADDGVNGNQVRSNTITGNELGVSLINGSEGSVVTGNTINGNLGTGLHVLDSRDNRFESNRITGLDSGGQPIGDGGVAFQNASGNVFLDNTVSDTSDGGVHFSMGSNRNRIENNALTRTGDAGIAIEDSDGNQVIGNTAYLASDSGIALSAANDSVVRDNDVRFNPGGLEVSGSGNLVESNDASRSDGVGITIGDKSNQNRVINNTANGTNGGGIYIAGEAKDESGRPVQGNLIQGNTANGNQSDGISVDKPGHTITGNTAHNNSAWGIYASQQGTTNGGGNNARGNGEPRQCFGLTCGRGDPPPPEQPDLTAPETRIVDRPADPTTNRSATFSFTGNDDSVPASVLRFECRLDPPPDPPNPDPPEPPEPGEPVEPPDQEGWEECVSPTTFNLAPGSHVFEVRAIDPNENTDLTPARYTWTVYPSGGSSGPDTTPPSTRLTGKPTETTTSGTARFTFTGSDNQTPGPDLDFECRLDGQGEADFVPCSSPKTYSGLMGGSHTFEVRAVDAAGNADPTPETYTWRRT